MLLVKLKSYLIKPFLKLPALPIILENLSLLTVKIVKETVYIVLGMPLKVVPY